MANLKENADSTSHRKTVVVDFDGVIAQYDGWKGVDVFGKPLKRAKEALDIFRASGWRIIIFTVRPPTEALVAWLYKHKIAYDGINTTDHNPAGTEDEIGHAKPVADVYIDDRDWQSLGREFSWAGVMCRLRELYDFKEKVKDEAKKCSKCRFMRLYKNHLLDHCPWSVECMSDAMKEPIYPGQDCPYKRLQSESEIDMLYLVLSGTRALVTGA